MKHPLLALFCATCALALAQPPVHAAPLEAAPAGYTEARQQFSAGLDGDKGARDAAINAFQALAASHPGHPLLAAYGGAAVGLKGRDALMPWEKMKHAENGADAVEKALARLMPAHDEALFEGTPESILTRLVAANALLALPDFMNRRAAGKRALQGALASPAFALARPQVQAALLNAAARLASDEQRSADEIGYLRQLVALAPGGGAGSRAAARLKELGL